MDAWEVAGVASVARRVGIPVALAAEKYCAGDDAAFWKEDLVRNELTVYEIAALAQALEGKCPLPSPDRAANPGRIV
jgi:hypothetical protein